MYARMIKFTCLNEFQMQTLMNYQTQNVDLTDGMLMAFKLHLAKNQYLHVGIFPDEATATAAGKATADLRQQSAEMGAKQEILAGEISNFVIDGNVTLAQLTNST